MRLIIFEDDKREWFHPLALVRPVFELRCGMTSLAEKIIARYDPAEVAYFVEPYLAETFRQRANGPVNEPAELRDDDLLLVNGRALGPSLDAEATGPSRVGTRGEAVVYARIARQDLGKLDTTDIAALLASARQSLPLVESDAKLFEYIWDVMLDSPEMIAKDFERRGRRGIEGVIEEPSAIRGSRRDLYVGPGTVVQPFVCIDVTEGPVYLAEDVQVHPFTRIEGPAYVGPQSTLLGTKLREGCSIGPVCRVGGEVEETVIHGYSNKYHDGFLGHAYVGEWVNLGALTTNSDLKNDYSPVEVTLGGRKYNTNSTKVGSFIGDHTKTSIGTLLNSGSVVGVMTLLLATGAPLPKTIPSFAWFINGVVSKGFGRNKLFDTARVAMGRRKMEFDQAQTALYQHVFELTKPERDQAIKRDRRRVS